MNRIFGALAVGVLGSCALFFVACEQGEGLAPGEVLGIEPSTATLNETGDTVVFQAVGGKAPFSWTVSDPTMGSVTGSGRSVTYARTDKSGANTVTVKDANQWTATAQVLQSPQELAIFPESATVSVTNKETRVFSAIGGTGSYRWEITSGDGSLSNRTGQQTTYKAGASMADTVIELFDGGSTVSATVTKTE